MDLTNHSLLIGHTAEGHDEIASFRTVAGLKSWRSAAARYTLQGTDKTEDAGQTFVHAYPVFGFNRVFVTKGYNPPNLTTLRLRLQYHRRGGQLA